MKIEILISTTDRTDDNFIKPMFKDVNLSEVDILIINQCINIPKPSNLESSHPNVRIISCEERGLSKSRNRALRESKNEILIPTDDDVVFTKDVISTVHSKFLNDNSLDIATFQVATPDGGFFKPYSKDIFKHNKKSILKVSSIEIAIRSSSLKNSSLHYDELFGLGSTYPSGEENIFLMDAIKSGLKMKYFPEITAIHPLESSGKNINESMLNTKGAVFSRLFGQIAIIYLFYFALKKRKIIKSNGISLIQSLKLVLKGLNQYRQLVK